MGARYRVWQFWRAVGARLSAGETEWARSRIPPAAWPLFQALPRQDQRHSLDVARSLAEAGADDPELLAAALLHDCGKAGGGLTILHRSLIVLLQKGWPAWLTWLGRSPAGWRRPFWTQYHHAEIGAQRAETAGCAPLTVWLIRRHHDSPDLAPDKRWREALVDFQRQDSAH